MESIRRDVPEIITQSFERDSSWPRELLQLIYIRSYNLSEQMVRFVDSGRKAKCAAAINTSTRLRCEKLAEHIEEFTSRCNDSHFIDSNVRLREFHDDQRMYYNSAANYCHFERFRIFTEELALANPRPCKKEPNPGCVQATQRSALAMIGYLGELIAAENYIEEPFTPLVMVGISVGSSLEFVDVPLFIVKRGAPLGAAAVAVEHEGVVYYIPQPAFGSPTEARSMQTLELVLQTVQAATHRDDLPTTLPSYATLPTKS